MADELSPEAFGNSGGMWQAQGLWLGQVNTWGAQWLWESPATSLNQPWDKSAAQDLWKSFIVSLLLFIYFA